ncbi:MAG: HD domain-containing protein [Patescibacteria group bacterium]
MNRADAEKILQEYVESESLRRHCRAVAASMKHFAKQFNEDEEKWYVTGLLHDFDYEKYPDKHPMIGEGILREKGVAEDILRAIQSHASYTGVSRDSMMEKTLFAVDELSGFVVAVAQVRPGGFDGMEVKSVKKKLKDKGFAAAVNRDDISNGALGMGIEMDKLIEGVIAALTADKDILGI